MSTLTARHLKLTPIAAGLLALCALLFPAAAHAGTPSSSGNGGTYLCLYNDQNQCADLADNTQSPGQAIDTWSDLAGGGGNGPCPRGQGDRIWNMNGLKRRRQEESGHGDPRRTLRRKAMNALFFLLLREPCGSP